MWTGLPYAPGQRRSQAEMSGSIFADLIRKLARRWSTWKGEQYREDVAFLNVQAKVAEGIHRELAGPGGGKLVILMGPTGSGKTEVFASVFLSQWHFRDWFAGRMFMVEPTHALLRQMALRFEVYGGLYGIPVGEDHGEALTPTYLYTAPITITTVDSYAYGYLAKRVDKWVERGALTGRFTMPVGVMMHSLTVFDEAHLIQDEAFLGPRTLSEIVCSLVNAGAHVMLATATLPTALLEEFEKRCHGHVREFHLPAKQRNLEVHYAEETLGPGAVSCDGGNVLVVVNTVAKARRMYMELKERFRDRCNVYVLHSLMTRKDREAVLSKVQDDMRSDRRVVLVGTQTVEVGVDLNFDVLYTEVSPLDSLVQRVGRIGRKGDRAHAYIYRVEDPAPYVGKLVVETEKLVKEGIDRLAFSDAERARQMLDRMYGRDVVSELSKRGVALLADFMDYFRRLHLFAVPPEGEVHIRPSIYIDIYFVDWRGARGDCDAVPLDCNELYKYRIRISTTPARYDRLSKIVDQIREHCRLCVMKFEEDRCRVKEPKGVSEDRLWYIVREGYLIALCRDISRVYDEAGLKIEEMERAATGRDRRAGKGRRR